MNYTYENKRNTIISFFVIFSFLYFLSTPQSVNAQTEPQGPVYIVQNGDTLGLIVARFGVSITDLMNANGISDPNTISVGTELIIPGLNGVDGKLVSVIIPSGETLNSLSIKHKISKEQLSVLNDITSPSQIYSGSNLILPQRENVQPLSPLALINHEQSFLEVAVLNGSNPWKMAFENQLKQYCQILPGETLYTQLPTTEEEKTNLNTLSSLISDFQINPFVIVQGSTVSFNITTTEPVTISGTFSGKPLNFFENGQNHYSALQGIYAKAEAGLSEMIITITPQNNVHPQAYIDQMLLITPGSFSMEAIFVDPITIDPANTEPEEQQVFAIVSLATPQKMWNETFIYPVDEPICIQSYYGTRRSYNDGPYTYFHTGLDFGVCAPNLNIYSPAPGKVVFSGPLTVRGNAVIVDHGWGIYSGFYHLKEIDVTTGQMVDTGTIIGLIGQTGRVTGPHLHYDLFVNGVQVEPFRWFENVFP